MAACAVTIALLGAASGASAGSVAHAAARATKASSPNEASSTAYLTVMIGRALASKAIGCQTPAGMMNLDQVVQDLAMIGVNITVPVIPGRTPATGTDCVSNNLYPSWADLSNLALQYKLNAVSASENYAHMTSLPSQSQQFKQSCGSLSAFVSNGFHRAWGLFAYPDNLYSTAIQSSVVQDCFAFGRTYANPHTATGPQATNTDGAVVSPWLQVTDDIGGGRCNTPGLPCYTEGTSAIGHYLSPLTLQTLTHVAAGTWTSLQAYTFVTGSSTSGPIQWDCSDPSGNPEPDDWKLHWTNLYEVYCWNDFAYALSTIPASVVVTDPATVAQAWGRIPTPALSITSLTPGSVSKTTKSTKLTWSAEENGTYTVLVGGTDCTSGTQVAAGSYAKAPAPLALTILAPSLPSGTNPMRVCLTNDPGHIGSATTTITVAIVPKVTAISPPATSLTAAPTITITGSGFTSGASVRVGGVAATSVVVVSPTVITAVAPVAPHGTAGVDDIVVTDSLGTSAIVPGDELTYEAAPSVTGVTPSTGPLAGGTSITITGAHFYPDATVNVGTAAAGGVIVNPNGSSITAVVPAASGGAGMADVTVAEAGGVSATTSADQYVYEPVPAVAGVSPSIGPLDGTMITITGSGFTKDASVMVGPAAATNVTVLSTSEITAQTPAVPVSAGTYDVVVSEAAGVSDTSASDQFTYEDAPSVSGVAPSDGPVSGNTSITISGANFSPDVTVSIDGIPASATWESSSIITAVTPMVPDDAAGPQDVVVTDAGGTSATSAADEFTYELVPTVTQVADNGISPAVGSAGDSITISGTDFGPDVTVTVGGVPAISATLNPDMTITAVVPPDAVDTDPGPYDVTVSDAGGTSANSPADLFTYLFP